MRNEIKGEALRRALQHIGRKGGSANSPAQQAARTVNSAAARAGKAAKRAERLGLSEQASGRFEDADLTKGK